MEGHPAAETRLPERTRIYRNHHLDCTRWDRFRPRKGDVVIATPYKSGTTWTQAILANLLFPDQAFPAPVWQLSPWLERRGPPIDQVVAMLDSQRHRRFIKTHLALDGLPYFGEVSYVFLSRDGRDAALSLWNHYSNYTDDSRAALNAIPGRVGDPLPPPPATFLEFWRSWCSRGWFSWESDGYPYWSHLRVTQTWWEHRHLPNVLFLHYGDMVRDPAAGVRRLADFLGIEIEDERLADVVAATQLDTMRKRGADYVPRGGVFWKGGVETFLHKGLDGRWRDLLSAEDLELYERACERVLNADCRAWLAHGGKT